MSLHDYAERELQLAGLFDADADYGGMLATGALEIVDVFSNQGHSGMSASIMVELLEKLLRFQPLTPLTFGEEEWNMVQPHIWQNKRDSRYFSNDGGKTHYNVEEK